jgi:hypothetical protein
MHMVRGKATLASYASYLAMDLSIQAVSGL